MAVQQLGKGVYWALPSTFVAAGTGYGGANTTMNPQSTELSRQAGVDVKIPDYKGETNARVIGDLMQTFTMDVIPTSDTIAHAVAESIIPQPGTIITITDNVGSQAAEINGGKYILVRATKTRSNTDAMKIRMELEQHVANDVAVQVNS